MVALVTQLPKQAPPRWISGFRAGIFTEPTFNINRIVKSNIDPVTKRWIRNANDERAATEKVDGRVMRFGEKRGQEVVDWIQNHCVLYEGTQWQDKPMHVEDWQYEFYMQTFGWQQYDEELARWIRRFTQVSGWIPKKNAKSPTLAATALYMLIGDGELGQKCYSLARDKEQAMIGHRHAMEMVRRSPILSNPRICRVHEQTGLIKYLPTASYFRVIPGENKKSTEGMNGSIFVDETHVVDRELMDRTKRAGISRDEPLRVELSTAGDAGDGYGYDRYQLGQNVISGKKYMPSLYFMDFSIPQTTKLEDLYDEKLVLKLGIRANPALGRIIRVKEFINDWKESNETITELRKFALYRLNLWGNSHANWIDPRDWNACEAEYELEDLVQYPCAMGVDLSKCRDMSCVTLVFAVPDKKLGIRPFIWQWFWLPEVTAKRYYNKIDLFQWQRDKNENDPLKWNGKINICEGKTIDYESIADVMNICRDTFDLRACGYDPYNGKELATLLYNEYGWTEEEFIPVKQQMPWMGPATAELERWILRNAIRHTNSPVMSWQFEHASLWEDNRGNYMVIKPKKDDYRKIDGIASLAIANYVFCNEPTICYGGYESLLLKKKADKHGSKSQAQAG